MSRHSTSRPSGAVPEQGVATTGPLSAGVGPDCVDLEVVHDDDSWRTSFDERHGVGLVVVSSALREQTR